MLIYC